MLPALAGFLSSERCVLKGSHLYGGCQHSLARRVVDVLSARHTTVCLTGRVSRESGFQVKRLPAGERPPEARGCLLGNEQNQLEWHSLGSVGLTELPG